MQTETRARLKAAKKNIRQRAKAARKKAKEQDATPLYWLWEFSKKVVVITAALYFVSFVYAMAMCYKAMLLVMDTTALSTLVTEANETFRVVVGGYMVKAGVENAAKIITSNIQGKKPKDETEQPAEPIEDIGQLG